RTLAELVVSQLQLENDPEFNPALRPPSLLQSTLDQAQTMVDGWLASVGIVGSTEPAPAPGTAQPRALDQAVDLFLRHLTIVSPDASRVIDIRFQSTNPERAAQVANMVADQYMQQKVAQEVAPAQSATKTLEKEIAALNVKVQEADRISTEARYEHGNVPAGDLKALGQRLDELNRQLAVASADRARAGARLAEFKSAIAAKRLDSMPDVLASPLVQHLHEEEAR